MDDYALVLNAGSSSLKFCVFKRALGNPRHLDSQGQIEGIGTFPQLTIKDRHGKRLGPEMVTAQTGGEAIDTVGNWLRSNYTGSRIKGVGHRVVHGGTKFTKPVLVDSCVLADLEELIPLAPLHQPHNLAAIKAVRERLPDVPQVACFDTSFHSTQPQVARLVPFPSELREKGLERYGFHGLSYEYIASVLPQVAPEIAGGRVLVAHLGNGASMCAMKGGKSIDSTFSFTALDGLCMGTRPGSTDPGIVLHLFKGLGMSASDVETLLYKKSGLLGISGISNDMRDLLQSESPAARLAIDYFVYRAAKEIGALTAVLGGLDALVFTAGIGENSAEIRQRICAASAWLGIELDEPANRDRAQRISSPSSEISVLVVPTNEELMIAQHTASLLEL